VRPNSTGSLQGQQSDFGTPSFTPAAVHIFYEFQPYHIEPDVGATSTAGIWIHALPMHLMAGLNNEAE
jgi:hypothetical protein